MLEQCARAGMLSAVEIVADKTTKDGLGRTPPMGQVWADALMARGLLTRLVADTISFWRRRWSPQMRIDRADQKRWRRDRHRDSRSGELRCVIALSHLPAARLRSTWRLPYGVRKITNESE